MTQRRFTREETLNLMEDLAALRLSHDVTLHVYFCNDGTPAYSVTIDGDLLRLPAMQGILDVVRRYGLDAWFGTKVDLHPAEDWEPQVGQATIHHPDQNPPVRFLGSENAPPR